ncbi:death domain-associated protein 6 isoform X2 [Stegostoma tigrinum]|uniref:death domain-associated protein 6 isoform X2 n=1 Tax=Stegostoma tigrinum TaxID=3053191 RepID=UPI00202B93FF|nr:death domain-associated protein 6 isoform X2 [Stegostoma tigrinum]
MALPPDTAVVNLLSDEEGGEAQAQAEALGPTAGDGGPRDRRSRRVRLQPLAASPQRGPGPGPELEPALGLGLNELQLERDRERGLVRFENQRLFTEFVEFCGTLTEENPEVIHFLQRKYSKAFPEYLASTEFRNVLGRCLTRVQGKKSKVFVYINELCTALKANSQKTKLALASRENSKKAAGPGTPSVQDGKELGACLTQADGQSADTASPSVSQSDPDKKKRMGSGSRRQIRYLENLLKVYADEIKRLQEKELDLNELEDQDSSYIQEHRLKKKMVKIFEKLCELKNCSSLTGRVIEQRIAFTGTRYPEINRKIERFINKEDHFPDYQDIRNIIQKVSVKHSLGLRQRQIQSMAQDVFREVGNRLQERRHLDLVYNFGSHLTDDYKPGKDPAMADAALEKRLRSNRTVALGRLDEVVRKYAEIQDISEIEEEEKRKKKRLLQSAVTSTSETNTDEIKEGQEKAQNVSETKGEEPEEDGRGSADEEEEEEDEDEDLSSDPDIEEELSKIEEVVAAEDGPQDDEKAEGSDAEEEEDDQGSAESAQSSEEEDSEEDAESAEGSHVEGGVGLEAEASSKSELSPASRMDKSESGSTTPEVVGGDVDGVPVCPMEDGVGSSVEGSAAVPVPAPTMWDVISEEGVGTSSENGTAPAADEGLTCAVAEKGNQPDTGEGPTCLAEEGLGSAEASPLPADQEVAEPDFGGQAQQQAKRKHADSSGQKLGLPLVGLSPRTVPVVVEGTITNDVSVCDEGSAEASPCSEPKPSILEVEKSLDGRTPVTSGRMDVLETDGFGPDLYLTALNGQKQNSVDLDTSPVAKRIKRAPDLETKSVDVIELMESDEGLEESLMDCAQSAVGVKPLLPAVDSTRADSPLVSVVTSSQPSPVGHPRVNVATQCDPEEIIVLSDSD